ncbi:MAG: permease-like cell division protein FtsX [Bacteroidota bacterium]|nr:permease-like cell division protein FtsX [Bacteroidota bacterium]
MLIFKFSFTFAHHSDTMARQEEKYYNRRIKTSSVSTVISITLVLFMMGLLGLLVLHAKKLSDYARENIGFNIMIKEEVSEADILAFKKKLDLQEYVKSTEYITKERAARELKKELGEDFIGFLGYNPLLPAIDLRLKADYTNLESVSRIEKFLLSNPEVKEVFYQKSLIELVNQNIERFSLIILGFSLILLIVAIALINNTIRLSVFSQRFIIRTMQLVGATRGFIRRPFLRRGILQGCISAIFALAMLCGVLYLAIEEVPELLQIQDFRLYLILVALIFFLGILISWLSTFLAVRKYLRMETDDLYA